MKRGHWPRGKRRHAPGAAWLGLRAALAALLGPRTERRYTPGATDQPSYRGLARHCGVADRTVRRWLSGEDHPAPQHLPRLRRWLRKHSAP